MATSSGDNVDYSLLNRLNRLVICSRCLRAGRVTPIPQIFSSRHRPRNVCQSCRTETGADGPVDKAGRRKRLGKLIKLRP